MIKLAIVYLHLLATCTALGAILATDLRLAGRLLQRDFRVAPPNRFVTSMVGLSLLVLAVSGAGLVMLALEERPDALSNPKLQVKIGLVALLALNALALHRWTFPKLARRRTDPRRLEVSLGVALPLALSNAVWLYVAFLGIARPWNFTMPALPLVGAAAALVLAAWTGVMAVLQLAAWRHGQARAAAIQYTETHAPTMPQARAAIEAKRVIARARAVRVANSAAS